MNYLKVPVKVDELCAILQKKQKKMGTFREQYELSFNAHPVSYTHLDVYKRQEEGDNRLTP